MSSSGSAAGERYKKGDLIDRGVKRPTPFGSGIFIGLRIADLFLQYGILARGLGSSFLHRIGLETLPAGVPAHTGTFVDQLGLSPYRLILLSMAVGSTVKQIYWLLGTSDGDEFPPSAALVVSLINTVFNSFNSLIFTTTLFSASAESKFPQVPLIVGGTMYLVGLLTEAIAETQRVMFKRDPANKGELYTGGLWSLARHINYGAYTVWRSGYALAAAGWAWAALVAGYCAFDFNNRAILVLDSYCSKKASGVGRLVLFLNRLSLMSRAVRPSLERFQGEDSLSVHSRDLLGTNIVVEVDKTYGRSCCRLQRRRVIYHTRICRRTNE